MVKQSAKKGFPEKGFTEFRNRTDVHVLPNLLMQIRSVL